MTSDKCYKDIERILRGEVARRNPDEPVLDNDLLERLRLQAIAAVPEKLGENAPSPADLHANDALLLQKDARPEDAERFLRGAGLPRVSGQDFFVARVTAEADGPTLMAIIGAFPTVAAAEKHAALAAKCTPGEPFDYVVGGMYELLPWPPGLANVDAAESPNATHQEILMGFIKRRNQENERFRERARADGVKLDDARPGDAKSDDTTSGDAKPGNVNLEDTAKQ